MYIEKILHFKYNMNRKVKYLRTRKNERKKLKEYLDIWTVRHDQGRE